MEQKLCILDDWVYKPHQLCAVEMIRTDVETGEIIKTQSTVFMRKAFNILTQAVHNEITLSENKDSINSDYVFSIKVSDFLDKIGNDNFSQVHKSLKLMPSLSMISLHRKYGYMSISLIPNIEYNKYDDTLKFTANKMLIATIKNDYKPTNLEGEILSDKSSYSRIYLTSPNNLHSSDYKTIALYEYFISKTYILGDVGKVLSINIDDFLKIVECSGYSKPSKIIETVENICKSMKSNYGLIVYYKFNYERLYSRIKSVSFRVYMDGTPLSYTFHEKANPEGLVETNYYFIDEKDKPRNIFNFKKESEHKKMLDKRYTNVLSYVVNDLDELIEDGESYEDYL